MTPLQKTIKYCAMIFALILAVSIIGGIVQTGLSFFALFSVSEPEESGELYGISLSVEDAENLKIELTSADLSILSGEELTLQTNSKSVEAETKNSTLVIKGDSLSSARVILTLPEHIAFTKADITVDTGSVEAENLSSKHLDFEVGVGKAEFRSVFVTEKSDIEIGVGKADFVESFLANTETEVGIGKFSYQGTLSGRCNFDLGITLSDFEYFLGEGGGYSFECGIGNITLDGENFGQSMSASSDDKSNFVRTDNGIGIINIRTPEQN